MSAIQWNLTIVDMLYSVNLSIADTFLRNQLSPAMVKPLYFEPLYSGHLPKAETFSENQWCPLLRGFTVSKKFQLTIYHGLLYWPLAGNLPQQPSSQLKK